MNRIVRSGSTAGVAVLLVAGAAFATARIAARPAPLDGRTVSSAEQLSPEPTETA